MNKLDGINSSIGTLNTKVAVLESQTEHLSEIPTAAEMKLEVTSQIATCRHRTREKKDAFSWSLLVKIMIPIFTLAGITVAAVYGIQ
ncbi:MAG: hypothetical protein GY832_03045 [Chloroflexi bacterium]|nr:hypothetical protein [Chloroflexota bacterium]